MLKYKDYKLTKPTEEVNQQVLQLIETQDGSIFHEPALNKIIQQQFNTAFYYLVDNPANITHASVVHLTKNKLGGKRYNLRPLSDIPYSGFIGNKPVDFEKFSVGINESLSYVGFPYFKDVIAPNAGETTMVDLSLSEEDIFNQVIHSKRRNMIRKALKNNISVKSFDNEEGLDLFWPILDELHKKLRYHHLDDQYFYKMLKAYAANGKAHVLLAYKDDSPVAGVFILGNNNYMHYYKGASKAGVKNEGQGELLQWEAIKLAKKSGVKYYDLCNLNKDKLPDIYRFKTGIANNIFYYPVYNQNRLGYKIANKLSKTL